MTARPKTCLLTVATDGFVPGTFVMVRTFLKHHPRFDGDVVVVHDGLSDASREVLAASFPAGRQTLVSSTWNYPISQVDVVRAREGIDPRSAKVLHFRAPFKPWRPDAMLAWAGKEARHAMTPGFKLWYDAYVDCLAGLRLRNALRRARPRPVEKPVCGVGSSPVPMPI